jgi:hypothetical protein
MDGVIIPLPHPAMLGWEMEDGKSALEVPGLPQEVQEWIENHYGKRAPE